MKNTLVNIKNWIASNKVPTIGLVTLTIALIICSTLSLSLSSQYNSAYFQVRNLEQAIENELGSTASKNKANQETITQLNNQVTNTEKLTDEVKNKASQYDFLLKSGLEARARRLKVDGNSVSLNIETSIAKFNYNKDVLGEIKLEDEYLKWTPGPGIQEHQNLTLGFSKSDILITFNAFGLGSGPSRAEYKSYDVNYLNSSDKVYIQECYVTKEAFPYARTGYTNFEEYVAAQDQSCATFVFSNLIPRLGQSIQQAKEIQMQKEYDTFNPLAVLLISSKGNTTKPTAELEAQEVVSILNSMRFE